MHRFWTIFPALLLFGSAHAQGRIDLVLPRDASAQQQHIGAKLQQELARRTASEWTSTRKLDTSHAAVVLSNDTQLKQLLPARLYTAWRQSTKTFQANQSRESYTVSSLADGRLLIITGRTPAAQLFGAGWLLRTLGTQSSALPQPKAFSSTPDKPVRGYQIGYRMKNNTYDAWTLDQFEQQMWDLAMFGMNTVQVIAPVSDDARTSPHFHAPAEEVVVGLSKLSQQYGLRYDLYYPEMEKDYNDPAQVNVELKRFEDLVQRLPQVDSLHVPGGDPGHTAPDTLFPLLEKEAAILHRFHPAATIWVSGQGFTQERFERFYALLEQHPAWLTGVFFGPQSRDGQAQERARIPQQYALEFYPDIGHTMHAQFPVPDWDPIFALTEGREPICPRPQQFTTIYRHFAAGNSGFMVYSEGVNDDVNKMIWAALGWNSSTQPHDTLRDYANYFFGTGANSSRYADAILGLEQNWTAPLISTRSTIPQTHQQFAALPTPKMAGWRWDSLLYRDAYDRYVQVKRARELEAQKSALQQLQTSLSAAQKIAAARNTMQATTAGPEEARLHADLLRLADALYKGIGLQLSVPLYGASNWERGANLDRLDTPLNDRAWLNAAFKATEQLPTEFEKAKRLTEIAHWQSPPAGGFYDDLGDPKNEPHLVRGTPWADDPEMYHRAIDGIADRTLERDWRLSWLSYAETLYETPLQLRYTGLRPDAHYRLRITYAGEDYTLPMKLLANGQEIQPSRLRRSNPEQVEIDVPQALTAAGTLSLEWHRPSGVGGGGRGGQVAEVWLLPETK